MSCMDYDNPAVSTELSAPPVLLQALEKDPNILRTWAKKVLFFHLTEAHDYIRNNDIPFRQWLEFMDFTAKIADMYPRPAAAQAVGGGGFNIVINVPAGPVAEPLQVIEAD